MSGKHSPAVLGSASARQIVTGLWRVIAELDELAVAAPPRWTDRIDQISATAQSVIGEIISERIGAAGTRERRMLNLDGRRKDGS